MKTLEVNHRTEIEIMGIDMDNQRYHIKITVYRDDVVVSEDIHIVKENEKITLVSKSVFGIE